MSLNIKQWIPPDQTGGHSEAPSAGTGAVASAAASATNSATTNAGTGVGTSVEPETEAAQERTPESGLSAEPVGEPANRAASAHDQRPDQRADQRADQPADLKLASKRSHKRTYQSLLNTPRLPPLKKRDGEALWREDIQYDFLHAIFSDKTRAFTNTLQGGQKCTFADVYIDAMANSSKCSRILGEKLTRDRSRGEKIAMVCLLVNWGRMNTTLNFFPEMRTVLRTYHPIPSLQTQNDQDYKQLQDAPRLKSILKGACEGPDEPHTLHNLESIQTIPRTNAINLVFLMSNFSQDVELRLIPGSTSFMYSDLIMDVTKSSKSRARAFLWLIWAYLEAPTIGDNTDNPFGNRFPVPESLTGEDIQKENVNAPAELVFGNQMTLQRISILSHPDEHEDGKSDTHKAAGSPAADGTEHGRMGNVKVETTENGKIENGNVSGKIENDENGKTENGKSEHGKIEDGRIEDGKNEAGHLPELGKPLVLYRPKLRSAKDRRLHAEFTEVVSLKRAAWRERRLRRHNAINDTYKNLRDLDPLYDSDEDVAACQSYSTTLLPGALASGVGGPYSDYGERSLATALALKRAARRVRS